MDEMQIKKHKISLNNIVVDKKNFNDYLKNIFPTLTKEEQYTLMTKPKFIKSLINVDKYNLRFFAKNYFNDAKLIELFFSPANKKIFSNNADNFLVAISSLYEPSFKLLIPYLLKEENYYIFEIKSSFSKYNFISRFLNFSYKESISQTNEYLKKHLSIINGNLTNEEHLLEYIKIDNPLNSNDLDFLLSLKNSLSSENQEQFYSLLKPTVVNTLIEGGLYNLLSSTDKLKIANRMHWEYDGSNDEMENYRYSSALLTNKDFFKYILLDCKQNSFYALKTLKYIGRFYPLLEETYSMLLINEIKNKKIKTADDLAFIFFGDYLHNLKLNLNVIIDYAESNPKYKEKLDAATFNLLTNLNSCSLESKEEIDECYQKLTDAKIDLKSTLYDYMSLARDTFANEVKDSLTSITNCDESYEMEGVKIHYYNGASFAFVVHSSNGKTTDLEFDTDKKVNSLSLSNPKHYLSTSYINQHNINVFFDSGYIFGFSKLENMDLITASYKDAFTDNQGDTPVTLKPTYLPLYDFSAHHFYSELLYKKKELKPDFLLCFDSLDKYDLKLAKKLKIDIVCINSKKYSNNTNNSHDCKFSLNEQYRK